jgi:hypothetical protein
VPLRHCHCLREAEGGGGSHASSGQSAVTLGGADVVHHALMVTFFAANRCGNFSEGARNP